jgi:cysteine desulfurase
MGVPHSVAQGSLRLTVGRDNTSSEMDRTVEALSGIVERLRRLAPVPQPA